MPERVIEQPALVDTETGDPVPIGRIISIIRESVVTNLIYQHSDQKDHMIILFAFAEIHRPHLLADFLEDSGAKLAGR
jgi:hypothetical protein